MKASVGDRIEHPNIPGMWATVVTADEAPGKQLLGVRWDDGGLGFITRKLVSA